MRLNFIKHLTSKDAIYWFAYYIINATFLKRILSDKTYLQIQYRCLCGKRLDLANPKSFTEKLQWLKVYDRNPEYSKMVDKYEAKKYVASIIGEEYIIPTLGVWDKPEDIDWDVLPDQFVLKCTHDSGGLVVCRNKSTLNKKAVVEKLRKSLKRDYYRCGREWPYKDVRRRIIAEQYMEDYGINTSCLIGYKFFCFAGEPRYCQVIKGRNTKETIDFFDMEWNHQEFIGLNAQAVHAAKVPEKPQNFEHMKQMARSLAVGKSFSRIDLYEINDKVYFGEITLYPAGGFGKFAPPQKKVR